MRSEKRKKSGLTYLVTVVCMAVTLVVLANFFQAHPDALKSAGKNAAMLAAAMNMPDSGLAIMQERFRGEIYGDEQLPETRPDQGQEFIPQHTPQEPQAAPEETPDSSPRSVPDNRKPVRIPEKYAAPLISENFAGTSGGTLIEFGAGYIKNDTRHTNEAIDEILSTPFSLDFSDLSEPKVLIVHTHATESFETYDNDVYDMRNTWRSTDNNSNMVAVGNAMQEVLEQNGIGVIHDTTQHDYPSYNGSYERSAETIQAWLEEYPGIQVVLDLHRDAMQRDDAIVKPVAVIDGEKVAQIMIISGCDDGSMNMPEWGRNLRFAAAFQDYMEQYYPDLTRPVYFCYRKYNMDLTPGSLLLEFGSNANTLDEAIRSAEMAGQALSHLILDSLAED